VSTFPGFEPADGRGGASPPTADKKFFFLRPKKVNSKKTLKNQ